MFYCSGKEVRSIIQPQQPVLSIISPALDEEPTILPLYQQILESLEPTGISFEIIFIDDGSRDCTYQVMRDIFLKDDRVKVLHFHHTQGKSAALSAGFHSAQGEVIVTLDADLQDDPQEIPKLLIKLDEGFDLVSGWKKNRKDSISKIVFSKIFNFFVSTSSHIPLHDINCGLKCYRREVVQQLHLYGKMHRFIPVMASWYGFRIAEVPVTHHPRRSGRSKYDFRRIPRGFFDFCTVWFLTHFRERPSHFFNTCGMITLLVSLLLFISGTVSLSASSLLIALFFFLVSMGTGLIGINLILIGMLAEFITHYFSRYEPAYYINETLEHDKSVS